MLILFAFTDNNPSWISGREDNGCRIYFMINLGESMGLGQDRTSDPWICSQTHICSQTRYRLCYMAQLNPCVIGTKISWPNSFVLFPQPIHLVLPETQPDNNNHHNNNNKVDMSQQLVPCSAQLRWEPAIWWRMWRMRRVKSWKLCLRKFLNT